METVLKTALKPTAIGIIMITGTTMTGIAMMTGITVITTMTMTMTGNAIIIITMMKMGTIIGGEYLTTLALVRALGDKKELTS
jgi:hypothetical protein